MGSAFILKCALEDDPVEEGTACFMPIKSGLSDSSY